MGSLGLVPHSLSPKNNGGGLGVPRPANGLRVSFDREPAKRDPGSQPILKATMRGVKTKARYTVAILAPAYLARPFFPPFPLYRASTSLHFLNNGNISRFTVPNFLVLIIFVSLSSKYIYRDRI